MKEKILPIISIIFLGITIYALIFSINFGKINILSVSNIKENNQKVNEKIEETEKIVTETYPSAITKMEEQYSQYTEEKQKYKELTSMTKKSSTYETKQYDITYIWKKVGTYATTNNLALGISLKKNISSLYDLNFTVKGDYIDIIPFIRELEEDSEFMFRIYNFKMVAADANKRVIVANFTVKNINIDPSTIKND